MIIEREKPSKMEIHNFLINLRNSGVTNMYGASPYLTQVFGFTRQEAKVALLEWMKTCEQENAHE